MKRPVWILGMVLAMGCYAVQVTAATIFNDQFATRPNNQDIFGTQPTTAGPSVGTYAAVLNNTYGARVDPFTVMGKTLKFNTSQGNDPQMLYLPYVYTYGTDSVTLRIKAAYDAFSKPDANTPASFNNFAFGFSRFDLGSGHNIFSQHVLIQSNDIQLFFPGTNIITPQINLPFTFSVNTFYNFAITYNPNLAGIAGQQPWAMTIDGTNYPIPVASNTVYDKLTMFEYVGFGGRFSNGLNTRFIDGFTLSTNAVPEPAAILSLAGLSVLSGRRARRC